MKRRNSTALYMRLSVDDDSYGDSVSIETQRAILRAYARDNGLCVYDEYVDDGWSGTNFDRPAFQRMMEDADAGRINCIVTKDLSRFGREHVMMDYYLEFVFPERRIRYVAVTDNEDTDRGLSDFVPFKNLFNEWYAKDTSRKVKAAYRAKYTAGEYLCSCAPLGYKKDPEHPNRLIVDEETRWIVEYIFDLAARGAGPAKIVKLLTEKKVPTPSWIHFQREGLFANIHGGGTGEKAYLWTNAYVTKLLTNEIYIGNSVHNKEHTISYKNKKRVRTSEDEWVRIENTHEGIISPEQFELVQERVASRRRRSKEHTLHIFSGLMRCGGCGRALSYGTNRGKNRSFAYFACSGYRQYGPERAGCTQHYIRYDTLYICVLARLQAWLKPIRPDAGKMLERLRSAGEFEKASAGKQKQAELSRVERRLTELDRVFARLYEDWAADRITEQIFNMLLGKYQTEQAELAARAERLGEEEREGRGSDDHEEEWNALIGRYADLRELTAELLNTLVERIVVHEAVKTTDGGREQQIELHYRFVAGNGD